MNTKKSLSNYVLLFLLVTVFLTMQWTTVHSHLAEQHSHDGAHHQHQTEVHAHSLTSQTATAIDFSHQTSHANVIEFDHEYSLPKSEKQKTPSAAIVGIAPCLGPAILLASIKIPVIENIQSSALNRSTHKPRAPPQIA